MKGIYLASFTASHPGYEIIYQDINGERDLPGDMMDIDLTPYDFIIATHRVIGGRVQIIVRMNLNMR